MAQAYQPLGASLPPGFNFALNFAGRRAVLNGAPSKIDTAFLFARNSTGTYVNEAGALATAAPNAPRYTYDPVGRAPLGLLVEPASVNLLSFSEVFTTPWQLSSLTATANHSPGLTGEISATAITDTTSSPGLLFRQIPIVTAQVGVSFTAWLAPFSGRNVSMALGLSGGTQDQIGDTVFDLVSGVVVSKPVDVTARIEPSVFGLWKCTITRVNAFSNTTATAIVLRSGDNGGNNFKIAGAQLNYEEAPLSYLPTGTVSGAREPDLVIVPAGAFLNATPEGTWILDCQINGGALTNQCLLNLRDDAGNNLIGIWKRIVGGAPCISIEQGGSAMTMTGVPTGVRQRIAFSHKAGGFIAAKAGGTRDYLGSDCLTMTTTPAAPATTLDVGHRNGASYANAIFNQILYSRRQLSAAELSQIIG